MSPPEFLQRNCPVCGSTAAEPFLKKGELGLVRCGGCGMIYANPVPREFESGDFYDHSGQYYLSEAKLQSDYAQVRFERELRHFRRYVPGGRVLDVGCSTGAFLYQLRNQYEVLGTDVAGPALDYAESKGIPVIRGNFLEQTFSEGFDAITFWAVVEHLVHPRPFLEKAVSILKPDGHCFVLVPNFRSLATRILGARYRYILPQHVNYFTAQTLRGLLEKDFQILEIASTHFNPAVIVHDFRRANRPVSDSDRAGLLQRTTTLKQNPILSPVRLAYRATEAMLSAGMLADNLLAVLSRR